MRNMTRLLLLILVVSLLATCFTGCFQYDPLGKETQGGSPAFDPDGDDEPDQITDPTDPPVSSDPTQSTQGNDDPDPTDPTKATDPEPTDPPTQPTQAPTQPEDDDDDNDVTYADPIAYGMTTADELNIRKGPGTNYDRAGVYKFNTRVAIYARNGNWGQTKDGWISMTYVYVDGTVGNMNKEKGTLTGDYVYVRSGPGTGYGVVRTTRKGDQVTILHKVTINGMDWGCMSDGWIALKFVQLDKDKPVETEPSEPTTTEPEVTEPEVTEPEVTEPVVTNVDVIGTWARYESETGPYQDSEGVEHVATGLRVVKWIFKSNGTYTYTSWFYIESDADNSDLFHNGKHWKGVTPFGTDGSFTVSGSTLTTGGSSAGSETTYTVARNGNTLTIDSIAFDKE